MTTPTLTPASALAPTYATYPFELSRGSGMWVEDPEGRRYLDFYGGHAVASLGHSPPALSEALARQARTLAFYSNVAPMRLRGEAAEQLRAYLHASMHSVFFCNSGTEANEAALKVALRATGRPRLAALRGAFHGRTLMSLSATDGAKYQQGLESLLAPCLRLEPNDLADLERLDTSVGALLVEPVLSMAGAVGLSREYLEALRARTRELGIALVFDEVQTGMGRLGASCAASKSGVVPDAITLAKGLGAGFPVGAAVFGPELGGIIREGDLGSTFGGGPLACAAVRATISTLESEGIHARVRIVSAVARERLVGGVVESACGEGWLMGLRMRVPAKLVQQALEARGILTGTSGDPHVLRLLPPLLAGEVHVEQLEEALQELTWADGRLGGA